MASDNETLDEENKKQNNIDSAETEDTSDMKAEGDKKEEEEEEKSEGGGGGDSEMADKEEKGLGEEDDKDEQVSEEEKSKKKSKRAREETTPIADKGKSKRSVVSRGSKEPRSASSVDRPTRERKTVERYTESAASRASATKQFSIDKVIFFFEFLLSLIFCN